MKVCSKCKVSKEENEFRLNERYNDGLTSWCKGCLNKSTREYRKTKAGLLVIIYNSQKHSSIIRNHPPPNYSRQKFIEFGLTSKKFNKLYKNWKNSGYKKLLSPSFDRKNDYLPYSFKNLNCWMTWQKNTNKGHFDRKNGINNKASIAIIGIDIVTKKETKYWSQHEASRQTSTNQGNICLCCQGIRSSAGGYYWRYASISSIETTFNSFPLSPVNESGSLYSLSSCDVIR